jgi:tRNA(adenine34) deaminase
MNEALAEARLAAAENEIPVGSVLVYDSNIVERNHNRTKQLANPLAHAEKLVIDKILASKAVYLYEYTLYVTLEPCLCALAADCEPHWEGGFWSLRSQDGGCRIHIQRIHGQEF